MVVKLLVCIAHVTPIIFCVYDFHKKRSDVNLKNVLILYNNVLNLVVIHLINAYFTTEVSSKFYLKLQLFINIITIELVYK